MQTQILVIDDEADIRTLIQGILEDEGFSISQAANAKQAFDVFDSKHIDLVILDIWLENSDHDGIGILEQLKKQNPHLPVLMISGHGTIETAVNAIKKGAYDFIEKPFKTDRLLLMIERALETARLRQENATLRQQTELPTQIVGCSSSMQSLLQVLNRVAPTNSRVLISGEAGAGKEVSARYLHKNSQRSDGPFVALNCATMHPDRIETELFGQDKKLPNTTHPEGLLDRARGGTLFLDEVADMPIETQGKILRMLQDSSFTRVGGQDPVKSDVRIIASTSRNLPELIAEGKFREDLYYRLNVVPIQVPPLRECAEDVVTLAEHFMQQQTKTTGLPPREFTASAMVALQTYHWPGNVRQLKNLVEWLMIMGKDNPESLIRAEDLPAEIVNRAPATLKSDWGADLISLPLREARELFEREYLLSQVNRFGGNISKTAQFVGMERSALHRKLKLLNVHIADKGEKDDVVEKTAHKMWA